MVDLSILSWILVILINWFSLLGFVYAVKVMYIIFGTKESSVKKIGRASCRERV